MKSPYIFALLLGTCYLAAPARAQESDTAAFSDEAPKFTLLAAVKDPKEKAAFVAAYEAAEPARRHEIAAEFLATYPQSWLIAQVYEIAAKSSIDLGEGDRALEEGRFSLRLRPENATLQVLIANVEAQKGFVKEAEASSRNALEYLDQFTRPGGVSEADWSALKPRLKASAYFALGRAYAFRGIGQRQSAADPGMLGKALDALDHSLAWNSTDSEVLYLRGLVELRLGQFSRAEADLTAVAGSTTPLNAKALLLQPWNKHAQTLPAIDPRLREVSPESQPNQAIRAGYAGSAACQACHLRQYQTWSQTGMSKMLRPYQPENIIGDFSPGTRFADTQSHSVIRMGVDTRPYFDVDDGTGHSERFHVDFTIGSKWQQAYATRLPDGSFQVLPIEYNLLRKAWINYWQMIDPPGSTRADISSFLKLSSATNYQSNCALCHTSQLRVSLDSGNDLEKAAFREPGVDCEMCHGPSAWHAQQKLAAKTTEKAVSDPPIDFKQIDNRTGVRVCGQCHKQSALRQIGKSGELNYASDAPSFIPISWTRPYDAFSTRAFFKDGRFRETTFLVESFTRSACYRQGTAQCSTCHSPHVTDLVKNDFAKNETSLKYKSNPNEMCLQCHGELRATVTKHTRHLAGSEGGECVSCHMPRIMNALLFQARSHQIEIPTADLTKRFGQADSPNACLLCHSNKSASWAEDELSRWRK